MLHANHVVEEVSVLSGVSEETLALVSLVSNHLRVQCVEVGVGDDDITVAAAGGQLSSDGVAV